MITVTVELEDGNRNERLKEILALWNDQEESRYQADADMRAEMRMERMMGC